MTKVPVRTQEILASCHALVFVDNKLVFYFPPLPLSQRMIDVLRANILLLLKAMLATSLKEEKTLFLFLNFF